MSSSSPGPTPRIVPLPWGDAAEFWRATVDGVLRLPRCPDTGRFLFPPGPISPWGSHRPTEWVAVDGHGTIWSYIVVHPPLIGQFAAVAPYVTAVVELHDAPGARVVGPVVAHPGAAVGSVAGDQVRIGARVTLDLTSEAAEGTIVPRWVLL